MKINPNITPKGISLNEIREITLHKSDQVSFFQVESNSHVIHIVKLPTVYFSDEFGDSRYFSKKIPEFANGRFLEIGSGTGVVIIAVVLESSDNFAKHSDRYVAIDINPQAAKNTKINAVINGVEDRIDVRHGDVFQTLREYECFDCIFWNHPFHKGNENEDIIEMACFDPLFRGFEKYVRDGHKFLNKGGKMLLGSSNFADLDDMKKIIRKHECEMDLLHYVHWPFGASSGELKTFNIYEIRKK